MLIYLFICGSIFLFSWYKLSLFNNWVEKATLTLYPLGSWSLQLVYLGNIQTLGRNWIDSSLSIDDCLSLKNKWLLLMHSYSVHTHWCSFNKRLWRVVHSYIFTFIWNVKIVLNHKILIFLLLNMESLAHLNVICNFTFEYIDCLWGRR